MKHVLAGSALAFTALTLPATAASLSYTDSVSLQRTNWSETLSVSQFDTSLGTLNFVTIALEGILAGDSGAESLEAGASVVTLNLRTLVTASTTALGTVASALPESSITQGLAAFDSVLDFAGPSGFRVNGQSATNTTTSVLTGSDMAEFIGTDTVDLTIDSLGLSFGFGAGSVVQLFITDAAANLTVTYDYTEVPPIAPVPLPAGLPLLLVGLGALGLARKR